MSEEKKSGMFDHMPSGSAFKAGVFTGVASVCIIGFLVLLLGDVKLGSLMKNDNSNNNANINAGNNVVDNNNNNQGATAININPLAKGDWVLGDSKAKVSIIEFSDADCPFCHRYHDTMQQLMKDYNGKINWVYRHFPLTSLHPEAAKKAEAIECVGELGGNDKVWEFMDKIYIDNAPTVSQLGDVVKGLGLDSGKFTECLNSGKYTNKVTDHANQAQAAGAQGTPYSVILAGDQKIPVNGAYPINEMKSIIDSLLK